jgi:hypothetical protein
MCVGPQAKEGRDNPQRPLAMLTKALKNEQQDEEVHVTKEDGAWSERNCSQKCRKATSCDRSFKVPAFPITEAQEQEEYHIDGYKSQRLEPDKTEGMIRKIEGNLAEPFMIDPGMAGDRERIKVLARELMMLEQILSVPHMPPDVRIVEVGAVHNKDELQANEDKGKNRQE